MFLLGAFLVFISLFCVNAANFNVNTLDDALLLTGINVGDTVTIAHRLAGTADQGGGSFLVTDSDCATDGATCFLFKSDRSGPFEEVWPSRTYEIDLSTPNYDFLDFRWDIARSATPDEVRFSLDAFQMHGHTKAAERKPKSPLDPANGKFLGSWMLARTHCGSSSCRHSLKFTYYNYSTSRRLERVLPDPLDEVNVEWWGAKLDTEDASFNNIDAFCWALSYSRRVDAPIVVWPRVGTYMYRGAAQLHNVTVRGNVYYPVVEATERTVLKVHAGAASKIVRMVLPEDHPNYLPYDLRAFFRHDHVVFSMMSDVVSVAMENIALDGNWVENTEPFVPANRANFGGMDTLEMFRNAPAYSGFVVTNHGGVVVPLPCNVRVANFSALGYIATGILGHANSNWDGTNVLVGDAIWNHNQYSTGGNFVNLTHVGFSWTSWIPNWGIKRNFVAHKLTPNPYRRSGGVAGIRGLDFYSADETVSSGPNLRADGSTIPAYFELDGFYVDTRSVGDHNNPFSGLGLNIWLHHGVWLQDSNMGGFLYGENGNGWQKGLYSNNSFQDIVVIVPPGEGKADLLQISHVTDTLIRNVTIRSEVNQTRTASEFAKVRAAHRNHPAYDLHRQLIVFRDVHDPVPRYFMFRVSIDSESLGLDCFVLDSSFNISTNALIVGSSSQGTLDLMFGSPRVITDTTLIRFMFSNVATKIGRDRYWGNTEVWIECGYFRNVTNLMDGRSSEDQRSFVIQGSDAVGEQFSELETNLWWVPTVSTVRVEPADLLQATEWVYDTNTKSPWKTQPSLRVEYVRPLTASDTVTISYEAQVKPWPEDADALLADWEASHDFTAPHVSVFPETTAGSGSGSSPPQAPSSSAQQSPSPAGQQGPPTASGTGSGNIAPSAAAGPQGGELWDGNGVLGSNIPIPLWAILVLAGALLILLIAVVVFVACKARGQDKSKKRSLSRTSSSSSVSLHSMHRRASSKAMGAGNGRTRSRQSSRSGSRPHSTMLRKGGGAAHYTAPAPPPEFERFEPPSLKSAYYGPAPVPQSSSPGYVAVPALTTHPPGFAAPQYPPRFE